MHIQMKKQVMTGIFAHAVQDFPNECCGFLFGDDEGGRVIHTFFPARNAREGDQRRRFTIDPADYLRAERQALAWGTRLVGIYHSHPLHPAVASEHDLAQAMPWFSYVIVSVHPDHVTELRSWRLSESEHRFLEETISH